MTQFTNKEKNVGFDAGSPAELPWQMVPLGGARGIKLIAGKGLAIDIVPDTARGGESGGLTYTETTVAASHREIWLQGRAPGGYIVRAVSSAGSKALAQLSAEVFPDRIVKIAHYFLPGVKRWDTDALTQRANDILFLQANVRIQTVGVWGNENGERIDLPREIDIENKEQFMKLYDYGNNWSANVMVYWGWTIKTDNKKMRTNGITRGNRILLDAFSRSPTELASMARTFAHELGHFLSDSNGNSHDEKATDLMSSDGTRNSGTMLRRTRIRRFIRGAR